MKLAGDYTFEADPKEVWDALFDPKVLAAVLPGCEKLELVDGSYLGDMTVKIGPIQGKFTGKVDLSDLVEPTSYKMVVDGKGAAGFVKATATIKLEPAAAGTKVIYDSDAQVGGKIASVGQRLVETSAKAVVKQALEGLAENIKLRAEAYRKHEAAAAKPAAPESAPEVAPAAPEVAPAAPEVAPAAPVVEYKQADAGKIAGAVAKEVGKTLAPVVILAVLVIAAAIYLFVR